MFVPKHSLLYALGQWPLIKHGTMETGYKNTGYKNTGYKNILAGNVSIRPSINFTFYKNIPVIRTLVIRTYRFPLYMFPILEDKPVKQSCL